VQRNPSRRATGPVTGAGRRSDWAGKGRGDAEQKFRRVARGLCVCRGGGHACGSRCRAAAGAPCLRGRPAANASSGERHPPVLPFRLPKLLRRGADRRVGGARVPATERGQPVAAMPAGPCGRWGWRRGAGESAGLWWCRAGGGRCCRHCATAGSADRGGACPAHATRADGRSTRGLRTGLSGVLSWCSARRRTCH
jgi:hypothetical protein